MIAKIISGILILITAYLNIKHGWAGLSGKMSAEEIKMMTDLGISKPVLTGVSILAIVSAILTLVPKTFFVGNILNAFGILIVMSFALRAGNYKTAFMEIPFLLIPLVLIYLGHPLKSEKYFAK
ncbi:hypothetical protein [Pollutibacter soli]|uniref:hypothetical protein n=1 Tax=Pollutibacter soli TaxID=3034157 RepID=UPI00301377E2